MAAVANLVAKIFPGLRDGVTTLRETLKGVQAEIEKLRRERDAISYAEASRDDVRKALLAWVDARHEAGANSLANSLRPLTKNAAALQNTQTMKAFSFVGAITGVDPRQGGSLGSANLDSLLCALNPDAIKAHLLAALDALPDDKGGLPWAERDGAMRKLDTKLAELLEQEQQLITQAEEIGLSVTTFIR